MKRSSPFKQLARRGLATGSRGGTPSSGELLAALQEQVIEEFARLTGLTVTGFALETGVFGDGDVLAIPKHPACGPQAEGPRCRASWRHHVTELRRRPAPHWHRCPRGRLCGVVPVTVNRVCVAGCRLVCPASTSVRTFQRHLELLDRLVAEFMVREARGVLRPVPADTAVEPQRATTAVRSMHPQVLKAMEAIQRDLPHQGLNVARVASELGTNASYLAHLFSLHVGIRMSRYIEAGRIERAKELLVSTDWQVKQVARESGHGNADWFSHIFRKHTGLTPREYRRKAQQEAGSSWSI